MKQALRSFRSNGNFAANSRFEPLLLAVRWITAAGIAAMSSRRRYEDPFSEKQSHPAGAAMEGVRAWVAPRGNFGQPGEIMGPAFRVAGALLGIGQAGVGQAQQGSVRLLDQVDLDQA